MQAAQAECEQGDPEARAIWQWCVDLTLQAAQRNYDRLGIRFDHAYGESFYEPMLAGVIEEALRSEAVYRDEDGSAVGFCAVSRAGAW